VSTPRDDSKDPMTVNIDKKAEEVAKTLMGFVRCPECKGKGAVPGLWGKKMISLRCGSCKGKKWFSREEVEL
jgi:predicted metal-binding protein